MQTRGGTECCYNCYNCDKNCSTKDLFCADWSDATSAYTILPCQYIISISSPPKKRKPKVSLFLDKKLNKNLPQWQRRRK